jgi:hypothetical protein
MRRNRINRHNVEVTVGVNTLRKRSPALGTPESAQRNGSADPPPGGESFVFLLEVAMHCLGHEIPHCSAAAHLVRA